MKPNEEILNELYETDQTAAIAYEQACREEICQAGVIKFMFKNFGIELPYEVDDE